MWQYVNLSEQIRPCDTLTCYWDDKQPTTKPHFSFSNHSLAHRTLATKPTTLQEPLWLLFRPSILTLGQSGLRVWNSLLLAMLLPHIFIKGTQRLSVGLGHSLQLILLLDGVGVRRALQSCTKPHVQYRIKRQKWGHAKDSMTQSHWWEWKFLVLLKNKKISSRGPLSWRNSMFVSCVCKRWRRLGGRKCSKMPESDICVCRKAKVDELHIVCMLKELKKKKKKFDFESLVLRKFRKITAISHPCNLLNNWEGRGRRGQKIHTHSHTHTHAQTHTRSVKHFYPTHKWLGYTKSAPVIFCIARHPSVYFTTNKTEAYKTQSLVSIHNKYEFATQKPSVK